MQRRWCRGTRGAHSPPPSFPVRPPSSGRRCSSAPGLRPPGICRAPGARSGPAPPSVGGSSAAPRGTSAPGGGEKRWWVARSPGPAPLLGGRKAPSPLSPCPAHQPPVDEVGQARAGAGAEISAVHPADLRGGGRQRGHWDLATASPPSHGSHWDEPAFPPPQPRPPSPPFWPRTDRTAAPARQGGPGQTDRQPWAQRTDSRTEQLTGTRPRGGGWPRYLVPFPVSRNGAGGQVAVALDLQLPEEPARLQRDSQSPKEPKGGGRNTNTHREREGEKGRRGGRRDGERWDEPGPPGHGRAAEPPHAPTVCPLPLPVLGEPPAPEHGPKSPQGAQPSPSSPGRTPGGAAPTASSACTCSFAAGRSVGVAG